MRSEKQLFRTMKVFSAQEDRADGNRLEKVSFDMIRDIMQLPRGTAGPSKAMRRDGFTHDWYHACSDFS